MNSTYAHDENKTKLSKVNIRMRLEKMRACLGVLFKSGLILVCKQHKDSGSIVAICIRTFTCLDLELLGTLIFMQ